MPGRHDAFLGAAEISLALEAAAKSSGAIDTVATTGICKVFPGAVNSIPSRVELSVDARDIDLERRDGMLTSLAEACERVAAVRGLRITREVLNADAPADCSPMVIEALERACGLQKFDRMVSRAYHDSLFMSRVAPTAMLFIPCRAGVSHRPDEYSSPEDITRGVEVLAKALAYLSEA